MRLLSNPVSDLSFLLFYFQFLLAALVIVVKGFRSRSFNEEIFFRVADIRRVQVAPALFSTHEPIRSFSLLLA